jgi:hypothetical protein
VPGTVDTTDIFYKKDQANSQSMRDEGGGGGGSLLGPRRPGAQRGAKHFYNECLALVPV